ncbi:MAG: DUF2088 domain-containing protein [Clostridia bacterium]|nr:DUF2088 domain-containing protein [Clostridia bacterium]
MDLNAEILALMDSIQLPKMVRVRQKMYSEHIEPADLPGVIADRLSQPKFSNTFRAGARIAITAGSRGVANIPVILKAVADFLKTKGAYPFIVPAMGSHGGATAEGQKKLLAGYGITEESIGVPILSSMEVKQVGTTCEGHPVYIDKNAAEADGIVLVGRIKPHTDFQGPYESGLMKMMTIGLGKRQGADTCHEEGFAHMAHLVPLFGNVILQNAPVISGIGLIENAYDQTAEVHALLPAEIPDEEPKLLNRARSIMARILIPESDVLVVDRIGKDISGDGMDPNISGTFIPPLQGGHKAQRTVVLDLTDATHGAALGIGCADVTTRRLFDKIDYSATCVNAITCTVLQFVKIPIVMPSDEKALQIAVRTCTLIDKKNPKIVRIRDTMRVGEIEISEALLPEALQNPDLEVLDDPKPWAFDADGNLW